MSTPLKWIEAAKRYQQQREEERNARRKTEANETTLGYIVDTNELCPDCQQKIMRP
jgi:hypothetical protein